MKNLIFILVLFSLASCNNQKKNNNNTATETATDTVVYQPQTRYGIVIDSLDISSSRVKRNEFLGTILEREGVSSLNVLNLAIDYKDIFDVRRVKVGDHYELFHTRDSVPQLAYMAYQKSIAEYVVYDFTNDTVKANIFQKEITTKFQEASGVIEYSLWQSIVDEGKNPMLAIELSEIYAWSVDFFGIAKGDRFKIAYYEDYVDSTALGLNRIEYALFEHKGQTYYAIPFVQDGTLGYFDKDGESLRRTFLKAPLRYSRISSGFSNSRFHPVLKRYRAHHGVDYAAPSGTPVHTIGDGTVIARAYQKNGGGNYIKIKHNSVYTTTYMHLKGFAKGIYVGARVKQGDLIGYVGSTGLSTGPHLDFRVFRNGSPMNPLKLESPAVEPISEENKAAFTLRRDSAVNILNGIEIKELE